MKCTAIVLIHEYKLENILPVFKVSVRQRIHYSQDVDAESLILADFAGVLSTGVCLL